MEGLDVASAFIPGVTAPMTKVAVKGTEKIKDLYKITKATNSRKTLHEYALIGQEAHRQIELELYNNKHASIEELITLGQNKKIRKDAILPDGTLVIIKPNSPSGIKSAKRREILLREHNYNKIEKI